MKFSKILMTLKTLVEETLPDWKDKFLSYKDLKKQLKLIYPKEGVNSTPNKRLRLDDDDKSDGGVDSTPAEEVRKKVNDFVMLLVKEIKKFNTFFLGKEEDYVIKLKELRDTVAEIKSSEELMRVGRDLVDLHGQMVLLENYSALNYTGLVKILKKYDKRSGALIRLPFIQKVLEEPFFKVDVLNQLVKECETVLYSLFFQNEPSKVPGEGNNGGGSSGGGGCIVRSSTVFNDAEEHAEIEKSSRAPVEEGSSGVTDPEEFVQNEKQSESGGGSSGVKDPEELEDIENMGNLYLNLTKSALQVLKEIRSGSSTVSMFSLPPLKTNGRHDVWENIPVVEQVAK